MNENVYQHFRKDEHPFIDMVGNWLEQVENQYAPYLTDFLDPRQAYILETLVRQDSQLLISFDGGYEAAERKRAIIYPDYFVPTKDDYKISLYEIVYPTKFTQLSHGKVLGTLISTGVKRDFFGDIISDGDRWQIFLKEEIANYIASQVDKIGKVTIRLENRNYPDIILPKDEWQLEMTTVSSLRIDNLVSTVYNVSRQRAKQMIETGKVKVNWTENMRPDFMVDLLDIISVRGYGRIQLREISGTTKKEKIRIVLGVLRK